MNKNFFRNKSILITGGTGSFGKALVSYLINNNYPLKKIIVFSRDELKQFEMSQYFGIKTYPIMRYFIGDVRDKERLKLALRDVDFVIHAAALKQVPAAEYNPIEFIKTNILGAQNIIEATFDSKVKSVIALSTDKASSPINLYGATKLCSDKLFVSANNMKGDRDVKFSVVRYGNVMGSRGSVLGEFFNQKKRGIIEITDKRMTRFNIMLEESVQMVVWALYNNLGGEIFVPKIPSFYVLDLAKAISNNSSDIKEVGIRPGEKIHEELISIHESQYTFDLGEYYSITPINLFKKYHNIKAKKLKKDFTYSSNNNINFLNIGDLKKIISKFNYL
jgi:UDP-N-acetylglucosamine 4,6-dehydratase (inverting)